MKRLRRSVLIAAIAGLVLAGLGAREPAGASCDRIDVWVTWSPGNDQYVTPWAPGSCSPVPVPPDWSEASHPNGGAGAGQTGVNYDGSIAGP